MKTTLSTADLTTYVGRQMRHLFPDEADLTDLPKFVARALERCAHCFAHIGVKGYRDGDGARFNHRHTDQYATFLYYLANSAHRHSPGHPMAEKAYALNKALHAIDAFYEVTLPKVFLLVHPIGTVLGRGTYADYFCCYHNCTIGANARDEYPVFGPGVVMYSGARIVGNTTVGANTFIGTGTIVRDAGVLPANAVLFGISPHASTRPTPRSVITDVFQNSPQT